MSRRHLVVGLVLPTILWLSSCVTYVAATGTQKYLDLTNVHPGAMRSEVEATLGKPHKQDYLTSKSVTYAVYRIDLGQSPDEQATIGTGVMNILLPGFNELECLGVAAMVALPFTGSIDNLRCMGRGHTYRFLAVSYSAQQVVIGMFLGYEPETDPEFLPEDGIAR